MKQLVTGFTVIWRFKIRPDLRRQFESIYGPNGRWAVLFGKSRGYRGTDLLRSNSEPHTYFTIDRWDSEAAFEELKKKFAAEYNALDRECEILTESETKLGSFTPLD